MSCIAWDVMTKWTFLFVVLVGNFFFEMLKIPFYNSILQETNWRESCHCHGETLAYWTFCLCQVWEDFPGSQALWEAWPSLLLLSLSSTFWVTLLSLQWCNRGKSLFLRTILLLVILQGDIFTALGKAWCSNHFSCTSCDKLLGPKTKFFEVDLKPVCKKCYDKYPRHFRLKLKHYHDIEIKMEDRAKQLKN